jgi:photosystem II stability/assembly factor-like uncharacterized protein
MRGALHVSSMRTTSVVVACALALAACDDDPTQTVEALSLSACPVVSDVNAPITLTFSVPLAPTTVTAGNVVVTDAETGFEVPGTLLLGGDGQTVSFTPSAPLPFAQELRIRVQNIRSAATNTQIDVTVCPLLTPPPPITELFWNALPNAGGTDLVGAALPAPELGYTLSIQGVLSKSEDGGQFELVYQNPYYLAGFDVDFIAPERGFAAFSLFRRGRSVILETRDGGVTFDSIAAVTSDNLTRLRSRSTGPDLDDVFMVLGGGSTFFTTFYKYDYPTDALTSQRFDDGVTGAVADLDFAPGDLAMGAAVSAGVQIGPINVLGGLFVSADSGRTWDRVESQQADATTQTYYGVAMQTDGDIFVSGGSGYFARLTPVGDGTYTREILLDGVVANPDPTNPLSLVFTDVQFAPDDETKGWLIGGQLLGFVGEVPQYRGLIFETRDGGATWTRQGVREAEEFGALFPRLNRLDVLSANSVWAVGNGGAVITYQPGQ